MALIIPYSFTGGTSAKAQEINANFAQVKTFVDALESNQEDLTTTVGELQTTKANLTGSSGIQFEVATATSDYQAVNLAQVNDLMSVFKAVISGMYIHITGNNQITVTQGGCYDSTLLHRILNQSNKVLELSGASTTFNIFITAFQSNPTNTSLVYTIGSNTPSVYDDLIYRKIGEVTSDENGNLATVTREES